MCSLKKKFTRNNIERITGYYPVVVKIFNVTVVSCNDNLMIAHPIQTASSMTLEMWMVFSGLRASEVLIVSLAKINPDQVTMDFSLKSPKEQFVLEMYLSIVTMVFGHSTVQMLNFAKILL